MQDIANNLETSSIRADLNATADKFFNNIYKPNFSLSQNINDAVVAHFMKMTDNEESAKLIASAVIFTSLAQGVNPIETIDRFSTMNQEDFKRYVSMFLNLNRVNTSYLGLGGTARMSKYVTRCILP